MARPFLSKVVSIPIVVDPTIVNTVKLPGTGAAKHAEPVCIVNKKIALAAAAMPNSRQNLAAPRERVVTAREGAATYVSIALDGASRTRAKHGKR
jgi:hypothetical protein